MLSGQPVRHMQGVCWDAGKTRGAGLGHQTKLASIASVSGTGHSPEVQLQLRVQEVE